MTIVDEPQDRKSGEGEALERRSAPRFGSSAMQTALNLGPLASLPGSWNGRGFSVMWRPAEFRRRGERPPARAPVSTRSNGT